MYFNPWGSDGSDADQETSGRQVEQRAKSVQLTIFGHPAVVKHPFRLVKRQLGYAKVRYRGLAKKTGEIVTQFALTNLWLARKWFLHLMGDLRP